MHVWELTYEWHEIQKDDENIGLKKHLGRPERRNTTNKIQFKETFPWKEETGVVCRRGDYNSYLPMYEGLSCGWGTRFVLEDSQE